MKAGVIIIDMQKDFCTNNTLTEQLDKLVDSINNLVYIGRGKQCPIVWVRTEFKQDMSDAFRHFRKQGVSICVVGSDGAKLLDGLDAKSADHMLVKKRYSAFFQTELDILLKRWGLTHLILAGIYTHACVRTTAIDAYQRDYEVIIAHECVASNDIEHHNDSRRYMDGKIAIWMSNNEIELLLNKETR